MVISVYAIESSPVVAVKALRAAARVLRPELAEDFEWARSVFNDFREAGARSFAVPEADDGQVVAVIAALRENGVFATTGDPYAAKATHEAENTPQTAPEPSIRPDAAAATALALVVMAEGNPLRAAAHAVTLCRAQGDATAPVWRATQQYIFATFPWVEGMLEADPNVVVL